MYAELDFNQVSGFDVEPLAGEDLGSKDAAQTLYRFQDAEASTPARLCLNCIIQAVDRSVFVTLASGGDCTTPSLDLILALTSSVTERAALVLD